MNYVKVKIQELIAALKPSEFRPFKDAILKKEFKKNLDHIFKGEDRIYLPFESSGEVRIPSSIKEFLLEKDYDIVDYKAGLAKNQKGRLIKIGKLLSKLRSGELLQKFNTSRSNARKDNLLIVISRHPYDIAGMSTGRGWTSCMNLEKSTSTQYVHNDTENGTIIAYLIDSNDKNINKPICRVLIKQFINVKDKNDTILYPMETVQGEEEKGFRAGIIDWLKTFQKFKGTYTVNELQSYYDETIQV